MRKRARFSPSSSTTWSSEASHSSVSWGSMSGSCCLNSSKYIVRSGRRVSGGIQPQGGVEYVGLEHLAEAGDTLVLVAQALVRSLDRALVRGPNRSGSQPSTGRVDDDVRVGDRLPVPSPPGTADAADERIGAVGDDPDDRSVDRGVGRGRGLDLDLFGLAERGQIVWREGHDRSVAHSEAG